MEFRTERAPVDWFLPELLKFPAVPSALGSGSWAAIPRRARKQIILATGSWKWA